MANMKSSHLHQFLLICIAIGGALGMPQGGSLGGVGRGPTGNDMARAGGNEDNIVSRNIFQRYNGFNSADHSKQLNAMITVFNKLVFIDGQQEPDAFCTPKRDRVITVGDLEKDPEASKSTRIFCQDGWSVRVLGTPADNEEGPVANDPENKAKGELKCSLVYLMVSSLLSRLKVDTAFQWNVQPEEPPVWTGGTPVGHVTRVVHGENKWTLFVALEECNTP